ncbi:MAG: NADP-dependent oxidoreductase [Alphaproteobacteria bacterium]|nr:NADP-dependent oxidoreductase [Alphaproteobacteria bacterium]
MSDVNRQWLLAGRPDGSDTTIRDEHFKYNEAKKPAPGEGEFLVQNIYFSVDPAMQGWMRGIGDYMAPMEIGDVMLSGAVGRVVESNHAGFKAGEYVTGNFGWQDYYVSDGIDRNKAPVQKVPEGLPLKAFMGALGNTGLTAYFGLFDIGEPRAGDTILVSGAAGAVGSVAGQLGKIAGCKVIGIAGGKKKCDWIVNELGFDAAIDYKNEDVDKRLGQLVPEGVNVFFDNVGGRILEAGLSHIAHRGRIAICGGISGYTKLIPGPANYMQLVLKRCRMEGFIVVDYVHRFKEGRARLKKWMDEGALKQAVDVADGFEKTPAALQGLFTGANMGKQLVKVAEDPTA